MSEILSALSMIFFNIVLNWKNKGEKSLGNSSFSVFLIFFNQNFCIKLAHLEQFYGRNVNETRQ